MHRSTNEDELAVQNSEIFGGFGRTFVLHLSSPTLNASGFQEKNFLLGGLDGERLHPKAVSKTRPDLYPTAHLFSHDYPLNK
jgi:hypothetical protein